MRCAFSLNSVRFRSSAHPIVRACVRAFLSLLASAVVRWDASLFACARACLSAHTMSSIVMDVSAMFVATITCAHTPRKPSSEPPPPPSPGAGKSPVPASPRQG
jgi:hypothetical protein